MKQGETLAFIGKLSRRANGESEVEEISDLSPYGIVISLQDYRQQEVHRFAIEKVDGTFITDKCNTSKLFGRYTASVAIVIDGSVIVANKSIPIAIERSALGESLAFDNEDNFVIKSKTSGTIESGNYEYFIEIAQTGSDADVNAWGDRSEAVTLLLGTILKGATGATPQKGVDYFTDKEIAEIREDVKADIPTKVSQLLNDSNYTTLLLVLAECYKKSETYTQAEVNAAISTKLAELVDGSPETLDTLKELADAITDNQELIDTLNSAIGLKLSKTEAAGLYATITSLNSYYTKAETDSNFVKFTPQELAEAQQEQARENIGAVSVAEIGNINSVLDNINREVV